AGSGVMVRDRRLQERLNGGHRGLAGYRRIVLPGTPEGRSTVAPVLRQTAQVWAAQDTLGRGQQRALVDQPLLRGQVRTGEDQIAPGVRPAIVGPGEGSGPEVRTDRDRRALPLLECFQLEPAASSLRPPRAPGVLSRTTHLTQELRKQHGTS